MQLDKNEYIVVNPADETLTAHVIDFNVLPCVSFCIPTKNNEDTIEKCLESLNSQNYPLKEIIIVDGYSTDSTLDIAKKFTDKIYFEQGPLGSARQKSIDMARGEVVALFDSDIVLPDSNWLMDVIKFFNYSESVSTVWPVNIAPPHSSLTTQLYFNLWKVTINDRIKSGRSYYGCGNSLFLKKCFVDIGGINPDIHWGEDFDWALKLMKRGYKVVFINRPLYHDTMRTIMEFYKKQFVGASTFTQTGFGLMGLTTREILYENFILGSKAMIHGIVVERDFSWLLYPFFLLIRILAYSYIFFKKFFKKKEVVLDDS